MVSKGFSPFLSFLSKIWPQIQRRRQLITVMEQHSRQHTDVILAASAWKVELVESHVCDPLESHLAPKRPDRKKWFKTKETPRLLKEWRVYIQWQKQQQKKGQTGCGGGRRLYYVNLWLYPETPCGDKEKGHRAMQGWHHDKLG